MKARRQVRCSDRRVQSGSATIEYVVVGMFIVVALLAGPDVIQQVWSALEKAYTAFYYAISAAF